MTADARRRATVTVGGRTLGLEYEWIAPERRDAPLVVFLHEGLGSVAMWQDFPRRLCEAAACRGLVYSREGYGRSTLRPSGGGLAVGFMHREGRDVLPAFLAAVGVDVHRDRPWLFGHSDGGSIALIHAATHPDDVAGLVVLAPHIFVEELSVESIARARDRYPVTRLREKLARYHDDAEAAFEAWHRIWLDPAFRDWNIEALLPAIRCPVLAIQGVDDEYGTMAQIEGIRSALPGTQLLKLDACGHSPHRDRAEAVIEAVAAFLGNR